MLTAPQSDVIPADREAEGGEDNRFLPFAQIPGHLDEIVIHRAAGQIDGVSERGDALNFSETCLPSSSRTASEKGARSALSKAAIHGLRPMAAASGNDRNRPSIGLR